MKIIWFVNSVFPDVAHELGRCLDVGSGWWMKELLVPLSVYHEIHVITAQKWCAEKIEKKINDVNYYLIPRSASSDYGYPSKRDLERCVNLINEIEPDCIHVFGSERYYGLACAQVDRPWVLRLQGVLNSCKKSFFGRVPLYKYKFSPRMLLMYVSFMLRAKLEKKILKSTPNFEGQTEWDRNWAQIFNRNAKYYRNYPIIRDAFLKKNWGNFEPDTIGALTSVMPYKGTHDLLYAINIIKEKRPAVLLQLAGRKTNSGYGRFLSDEIRRLKISDNVIFKGEMDANKLSELISNSEVFVVPSHEENESNSLLEAMAVGAPCIAAKTGGMSSMVTDGYNGVFYKTHDINGLVQKIETLFQDNELKKQLSSNAKRTIQVRHNVKKVVEDTNEMYQAITFSR